MTPDEKYLTAAYAVFLAVVLVYVVLIALKLARLERDLGSLAELAARRRRDRERQREAARVG
jgi:hypothetical protein